MREMAKAKSFRSERMKQAKQQMKEQEVAKRDEEQVCGYVRSHTRTPANPAPLRPPPSLPPPRAQTERTHIRILPTPSLAHALSPQDALDKQMLKAARKERSEMFHLDQHQHEASGSSAHFGKHHRGEALKDVGVDELMDDDLRPEDVGVEEVMDGVRTKLRRKASATEIYMAAMAHTPAGSHDEGGGAEGQEEEKDAGGSGGAAAV